MIRALSVAHSPDPDDAFMFFGIAEGGLPMSGWRVKHVMKDIQSLNRDARRGLHHVTAISAAAYPSVADKYSVLSVGASIGRRYGPIVVAKPAKAAALKGKDWRGLRVATPGPETTALLVLRLARDNFTAVDTPFDKILNAVRSGKVDAGLIIHEGQLTYKSWGVENVLDLGRWWDEETGLPLVLGLDVVRRDMGRAAAVALATLLRESIRYAYKNKTAAVKYALKFGRGIDARVGEKFVKMYVNKDTLDMGRPGERALQTLFRKARAKGLLAAVPRVNLVRPD